MAGTLGAGFGCRRLFRRVQVSQFLSPFICGGCLQRRVCADVQGALGGKEGSRSRATSRARQPFFDLGSFGVYVDRGGGDAVVDMRLRLGLRINRTSFRLRLN